jgi:ABC transport system ATP-binding/permease protein
MSTLLTCRDLAKTFHARPLFEGLSLSVHEGQRVALIGPNGAGKSTLLRILAGVETPDGGSVQARRGLNVAMVSQTDEFPAGQTCAQVLDAAVVQRVEDPHERETRILVALDRAGFDDPHRPVSELSGGWRKRLSIVRGMLLEPDLLCLDEPTNHLDIDGILWLEAALKAARFAFIIVSHDRYLLDAVAGRVFEISPVHDGGFYSVDGPYRIFLERRETLLAGRTETQRALAGKARREIEWMSGGRKAQTVKAQARVDEAHRLIEKLDDLSARNRARDAAARIDFDATGRKTRALVRLDGVTHALGGNTLFRDVSLMLSPGDRLGLVGANGSGKTTLIKLMLGRLEPDSGTVRRADDLKLAVFDQMREQIPQDQTLLKALCPSADYVIYRGRTIHIGGWAQRFLFRPEQLATPVRDLSGGEQARILLAKMMLQPADVLVLDEPTNDLDIATLDVLEDGLSDFPGAVVLVTHDRYLLDRVCTSIAAIEDGGRVRHFGDFPTWLASHRAAKRAASSAEAAEARKDSPKAGAAGAKRLTYNEKRELDGMEATIHSAEATLKACRAAAEDAGIASDHVELARRFEALKAAQHEVERLYARWAELEKRAG